MHNSALKILPSFLLLLSNSVLNAQEAATATESGASEETVEQGGNAASQQDPEPARNAFTNDDGFGGPKTMRT